MSHIRLLYSRTYNAGYALILSLIKHNTLLENLFKKKLNGNRISPFRDL